MLKILIFICICSLTGVRQVLAECHMGSVNFVRTSNVRPLDTVLEQIKQKLQISSLKCHTQCIDNPNCTAYLYDSNALNCYLITNDNLRINHQNLFKAIGWSFHRRICLTSDSICNQQWAFESYGSTQFNSIADKIVTNLNSEETCLNACSNEKQFICRSAVYDHFNRTCSLHSNNRNTAPDLFPDQQQGGFSSNLLYIENLCVQQGCEIWRTHFELVSGMQAVGAHYTKRTESLQPAECVEKCKKDSTCKSVNIDYKEGSCEFFDEANTVGMELQINSSKDPQQSIGSAVSLTQQTNSQQFNVQQSSQFSIPQSSQFSVPQSSQQFNLQQGGQFALQTPAGQLQQKSNPPQMAGMMTQARNRSLSIFQTGPQSESQPQQNYQQQAINDQKTGRIQLKANPNVNYFVKTCLTELNSCEQMWSFERHVGRRLELLNSEKNLDGHLYAERLIANVTTREQCQSACLKHSLSNQELNRQNGKYPFGSQQQFSLAQQSKAKEPSAKDGKEPAGFVCRAANFNAKTGTCKLLSYNQHTTFGKPIKLEDDKPHHEYIESSCVTEPKGFCNWKTTYQKKLVFADRVIVESNLTSCKEKCLKQNLFNCRALSFDPETGLCSLSHHSSSSMPNEAITEASNAAVYSELATCFKVNVECQATNMLVHLSTSMPFKGRVYARGNSKNCSLDVNNALDFELPISLNESICGTAFQHDSEFSNVLVIQGNDQVLTHLDKAIGIKCNYDLDSITGEAVLFINELPLTDTGRSSASLPDLSLAIMDINGQDRSEVSLGELLKVQVKLSDEDTYGVFIRNLIAKDEFGFNNLTLIDKTGCPSKMPMMREVKRISPKTKQLESYFEAFSFTNSNVLVLEGEIETCLNNCLPVQCQVMSGRSNDDYETVVSYGRRKREYNVLDSKILSQSVKIRVPDFEQSADQHLVNHISYNQLAGRNSGRSKGGRSEQEEQLYLTNQFDEAKDGRSQISYLINELGQLCFEPTQIAMLSGFTLIVQGMFFSFAIILWYKTRFEEEKKYEITF